MSSGYYLHGNAPKKKEKKEKHTYKSNTLTISLKTQSTGKNSINFDIKNLTAPPQRTAYIFSYTYKCACVCVCVRLAKNKFPYHFLCKSFGKQTEMCIKLQQCNKLRDAKVQRNNADWDGDVDGERWPERSAHCQISRASTAPQQPCQPPSSAVICKKLHVIAMATLRGPIPKGTPWTVYGFLCSSLFEKLTVWPQLVYMYCYCYYCLLQLQFKRKIINILVAKATLPAPRSCFFRASACLVSLLWPRWVTWWTANKKWCIPVWSVYIYKHKANHVALDKLT